MQVWRLGWQDDTLDTGIIDYLLKRGAELGVTVMDQILPGSQEAPLLHRDVTGHLDHLRFIGMRRDASHRELPTAQRQKKQDVIRYEPTQCPDLGGEEVGRDQHVQ